MEGKRGKGRSQGGLPASLVISSRSFHLASSLPLAQPTQAYIQHQRGRRIKLVGKDKIRRATHYQPKGGVSALDLNVCMYVSRMCQGRKEKEDICMLIKSDTAKPKGSESKTQKNDESE